MRIADNKLCRASSPGGIYRSINLGGHKFTEALILKTAWTELIARKGPWKNSEEVEFKTLEWVDWFNNRRLLEPIGYVPPVEYEAMYYQQQMAPAMTAGVK